MENYLDYFNKMKVGEKVYGSLVLINDERRRVHGCLYKHSLSEYYFLHEDSFYDGAKPGRTLSTSYSYSWGISPDPDRVDEDCENFSFQIDISYIEMEIHFLLKQAETNLYYQANLLTTKT